MLLKTGKVREDFARDTYWFKMRYIDENRKAVILVCASWEYLSDYYKVTSLKVKHLDDWRMRTILIWQKKNNTIFGKKIHYDVYANTEEGKRNGLEFLKKINID